MKHRFYITKTFLILITFMLVNISYSQQNIADARVMGVGAIVTVRGIVINGSELGNSIRYLQDATAGIAAYKGAAFSTILRGDSIVVTGTLKSYNQLLEIDPVTSFTKLASDKPIPEPMIITPNQMSDQYESELVKMINVTFVNGGGVFAGNTNYNATANGETAQVRINIASNLVGQVIPAGEVTIIGICSQFHYTDPNLGYQLLLRDQGDIIIETIPTVTTTEVSNISQTTANGGGNVTSDGGVPVTARGVCWNTTQNPTISDSHTTDGDGIGIFTSTVAVLEPVTTYYIRAYATNSAGTAYGNQVSCTTLSYLGQPCPGQPAVTYAGQTYNTVQIGTQCWFKENLNIGTRINGTQEQTNNNTIEKYCYNDLESNCDVYGGLYQWNELMQYVTTEGAQGICPAGWHIPTDAEWCTAKVFLDPTVSCSNTGYSGTNVGGKMKSTGTIEAGTGLWYSPNTGATNESGFTALPGGWRNTTGSFVWLGNFADFWSSSENSSINAYKHRFYFANETAAWSYNEKATGYISRCLKDQTVSSVQSIQNITIPNGQTNCYNATQTINVAGNGTTFTIQSGGSATLIAGQNIFYLPGTTIQSGGSMWGYIAPGGPWCTNPSLPAVLTKEAEILKTIEPLTFKVYPNPTAGKFNLKLSGETPADNVFVDIYGIWGEKILNETLNGERNHEFSLSGKPSGVYFIRIISGDKTEMVKIIKQ